MIRCHDTLSRYVVNCHDTFSKFLRLHPVMVNLSELITRIYIFFLKLENVYLGLIVMVYLQFLLNGRENGVTFSHVRFTCVSPIT